MMTPNTICTQADRQTDRRDGCQTEDTGAGETNWRMSHGRKDKEGTMSSKINSCQYLSSELDDRRSG